MLKKLCEAETIEILPSGYTVESRIIRGPGTAIQLFAGIYIRHPKMWWASLPFCILNLQVGSVVTPPWYEGILRCAHWCQMYSDAMTPLRSYQVVTFGLLLHSNLLSFVPLFPLVAVWRTPGRCIDHIVHVSRPGNLMELWSIGHPDQIWCG